MKRLVAVGAADQPHLLRVRDHLVREAWAEGGRRSFFSPVRAIGRGPHFAQLQEAADEPESPIECDHVVLLARGKGGGVRVALPGCAIRGRPHVVEISAAEGRSADDPQTAVECGSGKNASRRVRRELRDLRPGFAIDGFPDFAGDAGWIGALAGDEPERVLRCQQPGLGTSRQLRSFEPPVAAVDRRPELRQREPIARGHHSRSWKTTAPLARIRWNFVSGAMMPRVTFGPCFNQYIAGRCMFATVSVNAVAASVLCVPFVQAV